MDKILYCAGPFSTYDARFLYTQESDEVTSEKQKDIIEISAKYKLPLHIKVHPCDEKFNFAYFTELSKNYPNVKIIGGYWKWFLKAERLIPKYQLIIIDIIRTRILTTMAKSYIPCIIYTKKNTLIKKWKLEGLKKIFHMVTNREELDKLFRKFSFGELYLPENEQLLKKWFEKRETIQRWYKIGQKDFIMRRKFRHEWKADGQYYITFQKLLKRLKRIKKPPGKDVR